MSSSLAESGGTGPFEHLHPAVGERPSETQYERWEDHPWIATYKSDAAKSATLPPQSAPKGPSLQSYLKKNSIHRGRTFRAPPPPEWPEDCPIAWGKRGIGYTRDEPNQHQTFDVHVPVHRVMELHNALYKRSPIISPHTCPGDWFIPCKFVPSGPRKLDQHRLYWLIYIHGGAWRDPERTSRDIEGSLEHIFPKPSHPCSRSHESKDNKLRRHIAGIISINYSLTRYPYELPTKHDNATHPDHVEDIHEALTYLDKLLGIARGGTGFILMGHSCGATLAFQTLTHPRPALNLAPGASSQPHPCPIAIVGLNGIYNLLSLVTEEESKLEMTLESVEEEIKLSAIKRNMKRMRATFYRDFVTMAFGPERSGDWTSASPATAVPDGDAWEALWPGGKLAIIAASDDDTLVPMSQALEMLLSLGSEQTELDLATFEKYTDNKEAMRRGRRGQAGLEASYFRLMGEHNEGWSDGRQFGDLARDTVRRLLQLDGVVRR